MSEQTAGQDVAVLEMPQPSAGPTLVIPPQALLPLLYLGGLRISEACGLR